MDQTPETSPAPVHLEPPSINSPAPPSRHSGLRAGIWSLVFGVASYFVPFVSYPAALFVGFSGSSAYMGEVFLAILCVPPFACGAVAVWLGVKCIRVARKRTPKGRHTVALILGTLGIAIAGIPGLRVAFGFVGVGL